MINLICIKCLLCNKPNIRIILLYIKIIVLQPIVYWPDGVWADALVVDDVDLLQLRVAGTVAAQDQTISQPSQYHHK